MKKLLSLLIVSIAATVLCPTTASAQENEKPVTATISLLSPSSVQVLDEYISGQLYSGESVFTGLQIKIGAIYKKHDNLSWDLYYTGYNRASWLEDLGELIVLLDILEDA